MLNPSKESAQKYLAAEHWEMFPLIKNICYRGIPVEEFDKEQILKIIALCMTRNAYLENRDLAGMENAPETKHPTENP